MTAPTLATLERARILDALRASSGSPSRAAAALGWGTSTLYRRMRVLFTEAERYEMRLRCVVAGPAVAATRVRVERRARARARATGWDDRHLDAAIAATRR